ncbi:hypothetical protein EE612_028130, partial [Oryza sativa]
PPPPPPPRLVSRRLARSSLLGAGSVVTAAAGIGAAIRGLDDGVLDGADGWFQKIVSLMPHRPMSIGGSPLYAVYDTDFGLGQPTKVELLSIDKTPGTVSMARHRDRRGAAGVRHGAVQLMLRRRTEAAVRTNSFLYVVCEPISLPNVSSKVAEIEQGQNRPFKPPLVSVSADSIQSGAQKGRKRARKEDAEVAAADYSAVASNGKRIVVESCTQCRQFKIRAVKVKEDLESFVPGVSVVINPEKPRRGCLEIREEGGEVFISLLNMPRPFTAMKKLDMDEVIKDIAK